jgi:Protein of unknown function (DUF3175)
MHRSQGKWSQEVSARSEALDLEPDVFTKTSAKDIAESLKRSAESSSRRKAGAFRSAMSMLTFYINRAGRNLPEPRKSTLEAAKGELRRLFGRPQNRPLPLRPRGLRPGPVKRAARRET